MSPVIEIKNLSCSYGKNSVLKNISFSVSKGDLFIIIGPNGSGKTTLLKTISASMRYEGGSIQVQGRSVEDYTRRSLARAVALVPQQVSFDFPFTVMELVLMGRSPYLGMLGFPQKADIEIAGQALSFTGVEHLADRKLDHLSGGERQLVFISRAICQQPEIILLDEPTASLDLSHQTKVMDLMEELKSTKNMTIVMVSHDLNLAAMYGDTLLLLKDGRVVSRGAPEEVLAFSVLEETYGCTLLVDQSALGGFPRVTPVPRRFIAEGSDMKEKR
jgi:iron complex transport system ATP-binding protein